MIELVKSRWNIPQNITVTGVDDNLADGNQDYHATFSASSLDDDYDGVPITPHHHQYDTAPSRWKT